MQQMANLLLIGDEINVIRALKRVLNRDGYNLLSATNSKDAFAIMEKNIIDLIICDQQMPNMSGVDFLKYSKKINPDTIRILITGSSDINVVISAINEASIYYYFSKPWENDEIVSVVQKALEYKREQDKKKCIYDILSSSKDSLLDVSEKLNMIGNLFPDSDKSKHVESKQKTEQGIGKISVCEDDNIVLIDVSDILYFAATSGDVIVTAKKGRYKSPDSLNSWEKRLDKNNFFRCHRGFIVNINQIEKITPWFNGAYNITLKDLKESIPVSRSCTRRLKKLLEF